MPRKPRLHLPGGFFHVILRGNGRQTIFFDTDDRLQWQKFLRQGLSRYEHRIHAYCWMTNHVHMIIQSGADPLARFMAFLASRYARFLNRKTGRTGHLFERRYRALLVQQDNYLKELLRYVHLNPLRAHLVENLADYPWSSHRAYLAGPRPTWLTVDYLLSLFATTTDRAQSRYAEFVNQPQSDTMLRLLREGTAGDGQLSGDDEWTRQVLDNSASPRDRKSLDELIRETCLKHKISEAALVSRSRARKICAVRTEIALVATEQGIANLSEVARRFGRAHSSLSRATNRLRDQCQ